MGDMSPDGSSSISPERSALMARVKGKHTKPEIVVRKAVHSLGLRFRLHQTKLPGKPDLVLRRWKTVVFVNGCFWHRHENCRMCSTPKSRIEFWNAKFEANVARDRRNYDLLTRAGWNVVVIWECETRDQNRLDGILRSKLLDDRSASGLQVASVQQTLDGCA
jgi:DNA mismatch endonuclease (patch repair protein)